MFWQIQDKLKTPFLRALRGLFAICLLAAGAYWFVSAAQDWYQKGFPVLTSGEKGKDVFSGLFFSVVFMAYGAWELFRLVKENKT